MNTHEFMDKLQKIKTQANLREDKLRESKEHPDNKKEVDTDKKKVLKKNPIKKTNIDDKQGTPTAKKGMDFKPKCNVSKFEAKKEAPKKINKNESIFVLAGIETLLGDAGKVEGANTALNMIKKFQGGKLDPAVEEFINLFQKSLTRTPEKGDKGKDAAETSKSKVMKAPKADNTDVKL